MAAITVMKTISWYQRGTPKYTTLMVTSVICMTRSRSSRDAEAKNIGASTKMFLSRFQMMTYCWRSMLKFMTYKANLAIYMTQGKSESRETACRRVGFSKFRIRCHNHPKMTVCCNKTCKLCKQPTISWWLIIPILLLMRLQINLLPKSLRLDKKVLFMISHLFSSVSLKSNSRTWMCINSSKRTFLVSR